MQHLAAGAHSNVLDTLGSAEEDLSAAAFNVGVNSGVPTEPKTQTELDLRALVLGDTHNRSSGGWWSQKLKMRTRSRSRYHLTACQY